MAVLKKLQNYEDDQGNKVIYGGLVEKDITIRFRGKNNTLVVADTAKLGPVSFNFDCDNGRIELGGNTGYAAFTAFIRVGQDSTISTGQNVTTTSRVTMSASEGASIRVGNDVMIAAGIELRTDDAHPIFDVRTGKRVNPAKDISVGNHVWLGNKAMLMGGASVGNGSVIGLSAFVKGEIPNNCVAAGAPAKVLRKNIAWERPHLTLSKPFYKPDESAVKKSEDYWNDTENIEAQITMAPKPRRGVVESLMLKLGYQKIQ